MNIIITALLLAMVACFFLLYRNNWVCMSRIQVIDEDGVDEFYKLPSYEYMLFVKPWVFDINKFKK